MRSYFIFMPLILSSITFAQLPKEFVYSSAVIPDLKVEIRYNTCHNFVGQPIDGYRANKLILTQQAMAALKLIQDELQQHNLCLLVFDGYRPQRAVNHFIRWSKDLCDTINKHVFYPDMDKKDLFKEEYIATRSGHSRGSTVDLTIINDNTNKSLDMGSLYDFFGPQSWVSYVGISEIQKTNRQLLQAIMLKHGFRYYQKEWWHFTLRAEPFRDTYFDFLVE